MMVLRQFVAPLFDCIQLHYKMNLSFFETITIKLLKLTPDCVASKATIVPDKLLTTYVVENNFVSSDIYVFSFHPSESNHPTKTRIKVYKTWKGDMKFGVKAVWTNSFKT